VRGKASLGRWLATALGLLAFSTGARGEGLSLYLEPIFTLTRYDTQDQLGNRTEQNLRTLTQSYRLNFDRSIGPALTVAAGALYEARRSWTTDAYGATTLDGNVRGLYARLTLGMPVLSGGLTYDLGRETISSMAEFWNETMAAYVGWRPLDLPEMNLRLTRTHQYDAARVAQDLTTWSALGSIRYIFNPFEVRYVLQWAQPTDGVTGTEASSLDQTLQGIYSARLFEGRTAVYVSLMLRNQMLKTLNVGAGTVSQQQFPVAGLSLVEVFPALPGTDTLLPNPALIDGNLVASASVDIGYAPTLAGDDNRRDVGIQFADVITPVNSVQVWVDRKLPPEITITYTWTAYQSDDNKTWVPVSITGPVTFGAFQNRFEIPIQQTRGRYLKVVTLPLPAGATVDPGYANVFVTEVQAFLVRPADSVPREQAGSGVLLNATASTLLWRAANLSWDLTTTGERRTNPGLTTWNLTNTLSAAQWLTRTLQLNERLSRQDGDQGLGHQGQTDWSAGLLWRPLPTFTGTLIYSGQFIDASPRLDIDTGKYVNEPVGFTHSLSTLGRADLYEGLSALLNVTWSLQSLYTGTNLYDGTINLSTVITPNPWVSFTLAWLSGLGFRQEYDLPATRSMTGRIDASATLRPTNAISAVATVSRIVAGAVPSTYGTLQLNYAPLRGDLQLTLLYSKTFDTAAQSTIELFTPSIRWNVRPGIQFTVTYTLLNSSAPVSVTHSRSISLGLNIIL
jgi:hypothetical protein